LLVNYALQAFLAANHHVPRHWVYFIPSFLIFALWVGEALVAIWGALGSLLRRIDLWRVARWGSYSAWALLALGMLAWPLVPFAERYRPLREAHLGAGVLDVWRQTLKQGYMADRVGRAIAGVAPDAVIVCDWEQATALWYAQQVEGLRSDVQIVYPVERLDEAAARGHPLYVARAQAGLADRWHPSCSDSLIVLQAEPAFDVPAGLSPLGIRLGGAGDRLSTFELVGFRYGDTGFRPPEVVPLTLYWRALETPPHDYSVSLRLLDGAGGQVFQVDSQHPVLGTYPTSRWTAGEVVGDYYEIQLPPGLPAGTYRWGVVLYRALPEGGWESLSVLDAGTELAMGGTLEVRARGSR
jgi:hypothetical protein